MFGLWYIVFGVAFIAIMALVGMILFRKLYYKNCSLYKKFRDVYYYGGTKKERQEAKADMEKYNKTNNICKKVCRVSVVTFVVCCVALIILILVSIFVPISAKIEVREFEYNKEYIEFSLATVQDDSDYLTITGDIFEYNKWLACVKSRVATFGRFSGYYGLVEDLEPIRLPTKTAD